jgi:hypothetical protein
MSVFVYSLSLFIIGGIIPAVFNTFGGIVVMVAATFGLFFSLIQFAESDRGGDMSPEELDRRIEDVLHHRPR